MSRDEWRNLAFAEAVDINPKRRLQAGAVVPYVEMAAVPTEGASIEYLLEREVGGGGAKFQNGDTLFARITPCAENGKTAFVDCLPNGASGLGSTELIVFGPKPEVTHPEYVYHLARSELVRGPAISQMVGTTGRARVPNTVFDEISIPLPPLHEQRRIAEILRSVDEAIAATRAVIEQTRKVKQGVLERLLTKGIGHTRFKQTEIGEIPEAWEVANFGKIFKLTSGKLKSVKSLAAEESDASPYPAYGGNGIAGYSSEYLVDGDLIVIGRVGEYCGSAYRSSGKAWITDNALYTKEFMAEVDRDFIAYAFSRVPLKSIRGGGGQPLVSQTAIYAQMLALPSLSEQKTIVESLNSFDSTAPEKQLKRLVEVKSALMSDLLTGRKRVDDALPLAAE